MNHTQRKKDNNPISNGLNPKENHRIFAAGIKLPAEEYFKDSASSMLATISKPMHIKLAITLLEP